MNIPSENNPSQQVDSPLLRGKSSATKPSPLIREYPQSGGGLSKFSRIIPANLKLKPRANKMSRNMTKSEQLIWFNILSKRQLSGYKFAKQKQIINYIADFYCSELLLVIEVDGESHFTPQQILYDEVRTQFLNSINIKVIRISNHDIQNNLEGARAYLLEQIKS